MSKSLERVLTPEELELQRYLAEIDQLKSEVSARLADLETYKSELARFSAEYHAVLGPLFAELDRLELQLEEYRMKIRLLDEQPDLTTEQIDEVVKSDFREQHERIHKEEQENRAYEQAWTQEQQRPELNESDAEEFKRVYRELAKKHHPDFAVDEADRAERENAMKKVNKAFAARDLTSLKNLRDDLTDHLAAFERMSIGEKLVWAIREVSRLNTKIVTLADERESLANTSIAQLYAQENILTLLSRQTQGQIEELGNVLHDLHTKYHQLERKKWSNDPMPAQ